MIAMGFARFHARRLGGVASFRTTSSLDTLRGIRGLIMQSLITGDLSLAREAIDNLLAFADVGQEETTYSRTLGKCTYGSRTASNYV